MRLLRLCAEFAALTFTCIAVSLLHHGHIVMFLTDVRARLRGAKEIDGGRVRQEPSKLEVSFADPDTHYIVAIHRKTRSLEVGLHFEGSAVDNERRLQAIADRAGTVRARLGANVELERWGRTWTRVHDSTLLSGDDWSPKRDLTPSLAHATARRLLRFVRVLQPMVERAAAQDQR
jgi:hypothetical protein